MRPHSAQRHHPGDQHHRRQDAAQDDDLAGGSSADTSLTSASFSTNAVEATSTARMPRRFRSCRLRYSRQMLLAQERVQPGRRNDGDADP